MTDYVKNTDYAAKDALISGNPSKLIKGTELGAEFDDIATAVATKADLNSPVLVTPNIGTPSAGTLTNCTGLPVSTGISGLGTGVATALAVNVGSAGAPVVNGGALGTPSSGTVTNLTGTASININGTVGATTPAAGTFTTVAITEGAIISGTWTPTLTNGANVASSSVGTCNYMRVGNVITVSGQVSITLTASATTSLIDISLPIASNFASSAAAAGVMNMQQTTVANGGNGAIYAEATNDRLQARLFAGTTSSANWYFTATYRVI